MAAESRTRSAVEPPCSLPSCRRDAFHGNSVLVGGPDVWWQANASLILRHRGRLFLSLQTMTLPSTELLSNSALFWITRLPEPIYPKIKQNTSPFFPPYFQTFAQTII